MTVDSSALVAIVLEEPGFPALIEELAGATSKLMSSASLLETEIVLLRKKGPAALSVLAEFIQLTDIHAFGTGDSNTP